MLLALIAAQAGAVDEAEARRTLWDALLAEAARGDAQVAVQRYRELSRTLGAAWHIVGELGFAPALDVCANCHTPLANDARTPFSHVAGGALCDRCGRLVPGARTIPPEARATLGEWLSGSMVQLANASEGRAHQRLLREFLDQHLRAGAHSGH